MSRPESSWRKYRRSSEPGRSVAEAMGPVSRPRLRWVRWPGSGGAEGVEHPGEHEGLVAPGVVAAAGAYVTGAHLGLEQQLVPVGLRGPQLRHPLGRLPVADPGVVEPGGGEDRWVVLGLDVL